MIPRPFTFFFFNDTATTEIYTLSLHDALPISTGNVPSVASPAANVTACGSAMPTSKNLEGIAEPRSEEHTSELQSHSDLVCRLLLGKKNKVQADNLQKTLRTHADIEFTATAFG